MGLGAVSIVQRGSTRTLVSSTAAVRPSVGPMRHIFGSSSVSIPSGRSLNVIVGARDVMLDGSELDQDKRNKDGSSGIFHRRPRQSFLKIPLNIFLAGNVSIAFRWPKRLNVNDAMIRVTVFVLVCSNFLQALHRDCIFDDLGRWRSPYLSCTASSASCSTRRP